ncbi:hypothetical protein ACHELOUS_171 [Vibrio phage Achelous]|uniref:Uncharacterized protein n=1 Tax=Vibrio phage Achelous TaxID=2576872 RepID=A0A4P8N7C6_9CAUD|nr:hypothetical protein KNU52_gp124 [Vibrio phage Achelous]QCQ57746.1 hypothetical protein ACHELOUS_171 [Vibrio phage Achelous]QIG66464.1 hypothetical protein CHAZLY21_173 [Vibrio phage Chazly21]WBU76388.1 hypothetical protein WYMAN_173 [Vibrio phage Wyman]
MTYTEFELNFFRIQSKVREYRLGQHFINMFILDNSSLPPELWYETNIEKARAMIYQIMDDYCWEWDSMPDLGGYNDI